LLYCFMIIYAIYMDVNQQRHHFGICDDRNTRRHVGVLSGFFTRMTTHVVPIKEQLRASFIYL